LKKKGFAINEANGSDKNVSPFFFKNVLITENSLYEKGINWIATRDQAKKEIVKAVPFA
jgi:hypothetical protein